MNSEEMLYLARVRIVRAGELLQDAKNLIDKKSYKSANNRAYYAIEKAVSAVLIANGISCESHSGCVLQFNKCIRDGIIPFEHSDFVIFKDAENIRSASDYDDFYIVNIPKTMETYENAQQLVSKAKGYLISLGCDVSPYQE